MSIFGGNSAPQQTPIVLPAAPVAAAPAGDTARRNALNRGRGSSILTSELGVTDTSTLSPRKLLGMSV